MSFRTVVISKRCKLDLRPVSMAKYCEIINTFVPFTLNKKSLISAVISRLEKESVKDDYYLRGQKLLSETEKYIDDLCYELDCVLEYTKLSMGSIIKAASPEIQDCYESLPEKIIDYMELVREFEGERLFIMVNVRSYFTDEEMASFIETAINHGIKILLLESTERPKLKNEIRLTVDKDLCVF